MIDVNALDFSKGDGLVTIVTQDWASGSVLMVAHADREAIQQTIGTGEMHYRSRSRGLWRKGATSGNTQRVVSLTADCDGDAVLARVVVAGPACHTGKLSCFGGEAMSPDVFSRLSEVIESRASSVVAEGRSGQADESAKSYTKRLLGDRNLRLKKIGEEAAELVTAAADGDRERAVEEAADVIYHTLVALRSLGAGVGEIRTALATREH